jgi:very-short-patch-repair endonuclease
MKCERCGNEHDGSYGSGKYCSVKCARSRGPRTKEFKEKVSKKLTKHVIEERVCPICSKKYNRSTADKRKTCSNSCGSVLKWQDPEYREYMSNVNSRTAKEKHSNPDVNFGWQTRKKIKPSYPESIAIRFFEEHNIKFDREVKCGKYFIDFVVGNYAIEIDGQQHKLPERIEIDKIKNEVMTSEGYDIIRISYPEENIRETLYRTLV